MTMDKMTAKAKALEASIRHHKRNARAWFPWQAKLGSKYCALCQIYVERNSNCDGCPINERTGGFGCNGTPYNQMADALRDWRRAGWWNRAARAEFRRAALDEVAFLESLREEG